MHILPELPCNLPHHFLNPLLAWFSSYVYAFLTLRDPEDVWLHLEQVLDFAPIEAACSEYHKHRIGVAHSVPRLCRALFIKHFRTLSLRETEACLRYDLRCKRFAGYLIHEEAADHSTLSRFESYVMQTHPRLYFDTFLRQIDELTSRRHHHHTQFADTFAMRADAAAESVLHMLRHGCRQLLQLPEHRSLHLEIDPVRLFGRADEKHWFRLSADERAAVRFDTVAASLQLLSLVEAHPKRSADSRQLVGFLRKILADELSLEFVEDGSLLSVRALSSKELGSYRIGSMTDPDASFRNHGKDDIVLGYNISVASDDTFVREIRADTGSTPDASPIAHLLTAQREHHDCLPDNLVYDRAAGLPHHLGVVDRVSDGQTRLVVQLVDRSRDGRSFTPADFSLSEDGLSLTCPNEVTTFIAYDSGSGDGLNFRFSRDHCADCPLMQACGRKPHSKFRSVFISTHRPLADALRSFCRLPRFDFLLRSRSFVERIIAGLVRYNGARRATRRGLQAADFQVKMAATAFNVKTLLRVLRARGRGAPG